MPNQKKIKTNNSASLLILNYHRVAENQSSDSLFSIYPKVFREHLQILRENNLPVIKTGLQEQKIADNNFAVGITFDDGNVSDYDVVLPMLREFNFTASFFPIVSHLGQAGKLTWSQLREISEAGCEVGSHGMTHEIMVKQEPLKQSQEFVDSKKMIEDQVGKPVSQFAFPFGRHNDELVEMCKKTGYRQALTTGLKVNKLAENPFLIYRWNITQKTNTELLRQVISSQGALSPSLELTNKLKGL